MFRFTLVSLVLSLIILGNAFIIQADEVETPKEADDKKSDETKPEEKKPAKLYDLKPVYAKDMSWQEEIKLKSVKYYKYSEDYIITSDDTMSMKLKAQITEIKDNAPTKVKYSDCNGSGAETSSYGEERDYTHEYKITKGVVEADVKSDLTLKLTKTENMMDDVLSVFPGSVLSWFIAPIRAVKVGDTWDSNELPVNKASFETESGKFEDITGKFKLNEVSTKDGKEFAHILWTGKGKLTQYMSTGPYDVSWNITIVFDLASKRVISSDGEATALLGDGNTASLKLTINKKATYEKEKKPVEKAPIKPKDEDDE